MSFWKRSANHRQRIPYELQLFHLENLEVRLVALNNLIVFEMFNATDPQEFSRIILRIKRVNKKLSQGN